MKRVAVHQALWEAAIMSPAAVLRAEWRWYGSITLGATSLGLAAALLSGTEYRAEISGIVGACLQLALMWMAMNADQDIKAGLSVQRETLITDLLGRDVGVFGLRFLALALVALPLSLMTGVLVGFLTTLTVRYENGIMGGMIAAAVSFVAIKTLILSKSIVWIVEARRRTSLSGALHRQKSTIKTMAVILLAVGASMAVLKLGFPGADAVWSSGGDESGFVFYLRLIFMTAVWYGSEGAAGVIMGVVLSTCSVAYASQVDEPNRAYPSPGREAKRQNENEKF